jgi:tetratricopeptide (TPR) repeat protein
MTDLFSVQDEIARSVVDALRLRLLPEQQLAVTRHRTRSQPAYDAYLAGQRRLYEGGGDNERRAIGHYERAIELDPEFSTAYYALALLLGGDANWADSPEQVAAGKQRSLRLIDKAIELEPDRVDFYLQRADFLYYTAHDWHAAQRDLDVAARLYHRRPPELLAKQTRLLAVLGRLDEAIAIERAAVKENPNSTWAWAHLGYHLVAAGRAAEARAALERAVALRPEDDHANYYDGLGWLLADEPGKAIAAFERSGSVFRLAGLAAAQYDAGNAAASDQALQTLVTRHAPIGAYQVAEAHAWRGEKDEAFAWLARAERQYDAGLAQLRFDPMMRKLHDDPRYLAWLARLHLDDASVQRTRAE